MARILKFLLIVIILFLIGCSEDTTQVTEMKILVGYDAFSDDCLIDVKKDGTVEYTTLKASMIFDYQTKEIKKDIEIGEPEEYIFERATTKLSNKDKATINELVKKMLSKEPIERIVADGATKIYGFIEEKEYKSSFDWYGKGEHYDENLAELCFTLIDAAPFGFKVGGEDNPLKVPSGKLRKSMYARELDETGRIK